MVPIFTLSGEAKTSVSKPRVVHGI
jgi:hypothetical protein